MANENVVQNDVIVPADEDREMLLITATRNKNDAMFWNYITVPAGTDPREFIKTITENKVVNLVDARNVRAFIEAGAPLRELTDIIAQVDAGTLEGRWDNPEAIANCLDGKDVGIRLEQHIRTLDWNVEYCYIKEEREA